MLDRPVNCNTAPPDSAGRLGSWLDVFHGIGDRSDVIWRGPAASADDVDEAGAGKVTDEGGGLLRSLVISPESVRQS